MTPVSGIPASQVTSSGQYASQAQGSKKSSSKSSGSEGPHQASNASSEVEQNSQDSTNQSVQTPASFDENLLLLQGEGSQFVRATPMEKGDETSTEKSKEEESSQPTMPSFLNPVGLAKLSGKETINSAFDDGLVPWSADWVFDPKVGPTSEVKPLISESVDEKSSPEDLIKLMKKITLLDTKLGEAAQKIQAGKETLSQSSPDETPAATKAIESGKATPLGREEQLLKSIQELGGQISEKQVSSHSDSQKKVSSPTTLAGTDFVQTRNSVQGESKQNLTDSRLTEVMPAPEKQVSTFSKQLSESNPTLDVNSIHSSEATPVGASVSTASSRENFRIQPKEITAHVVPGSMMKERLTRESLLQISDGIQDMKFKGGGEMKIQLKPEALGELHLRVVTQGNQVGLKIMAAEHGAKQILEESMIHLKEALGGHQLSLAKTDIGLMSQNHSSYSSHEQTLNDEFSQNLFKSSQSGEENQPFGEKDTQDSRESVGTDRLHYKRSRALAGEPTQVMGLDRKGQTLSPGRLDVIA